MQNARKILLSAFRGSLIWLSFVCSAQQVTNGILWNKLEDIQKNDSLSGAQKLAARYSVKNEFEEANLQRDSVYARVLLGIGVSEFTERHDFKKALTYTQGSLAINNSNIKGASKYYAAQAYYNLGYFYNGVNAFNKAMVYVDSAIILAKMTHASDLILESMYLQTSILFQSGDYEKCADECLNGMDFLLQEKDSSSYFYFFNLEVQSECFENHVMDASGRIDDLIRFANAMNNEMELATALTSKALICKKLGRWETAITLYELAIKKNTEVNEYHSAALNYNDLGLLYMDSLGKYTEAKKCYDKAIYLEKANSDNTTLALINNNIEEVFFHEHNYINAARYCISALHYLQINCRDILTNPPANQLREVDAKDLILIVMSNKMNILLQLFNTTADRAYLTACLQTALVTDTLFNQTRHMQSGEDSKLFWRDFAKGFYANALNACYMAKDNEKAFYFMEKSRAALLNDKLNELGASAYLPPNEAAMERDYKIDVTIDQQKLALLNKASPEYAKQQSALRKADENLQRYIYSIEEKYPAYYKYKYADESPSLRDMQKYLANIHTEAFIHFFITDSTAFILVTTANTAKFFKLFAIDFNKADLALFEGYCADRSALNGDYARFAALSNRLYKALFQSLQVKPGRIIICTDDFLIPFEALSADSLGNNFLIYNYTFSYVYSASYLLRKFTLQQPEGNFFGIAPVYFSSYSNLPDLPQSGEALKQSRYYYTRAKLLTTGEATRKNFFRFAPSYAVVTVFSHATAGSSNGNEPVIYMRDSTIHLSELTYLINPSTQLVILSACETNAGKKAAGEGIYSLARGFSGAGIPSVTATLWNADEEATYAITREFNRNLAAGMQKDEALRQAKLAYMKAGQSNLLPYYWANMIIAGNVQPLKLSGGSNFPWLIVISSAIVLISLLAVLGFYRGMRVRGRNPPAVVAGDETV